MESVPVNIILSANILRYILSSNGSRCVHDSSVLDTPQVHTAVILKIITVELVRLGVGHEDLNWPSDNSDIMSGHT